jgi:hypothetical protein
MKVVLLGTGGVMKTFNFGKILKTCIASRGHHSRYSEIFDRVHGLNQISDYSSNMI